MSTYFLLCRYNGPNPTTWTSDNDYNKMMQKTGRGVEYGGINSFSNLNRQLQLDDLDVFCMLARKNSDLWADTNSPWFGLSPDNFSQVPQELYAWGHHDMVLAVDLWYLVFVTGHNPIHTAGSHPPKWTRKGGPFVAVPRANPPKAAVGNAEIKNVVNNW